MAKIIIDLPTDEQFCGGCPFCQEAKLIKGEDENCYAICTHFEQILKKRTRKNQFGMPFDAELRCKECLDAEVEESLQQGGEQK